MRVGRTSGLAVTTNTLPEVTMATMVMSPGDPPPHPQEILRDMARARLWAQLWFR